MINRIPDFIIPLFASALLLLSVNPSFASSECEGKYKDGRRPSDEELAVIIQQHSEWLHTYKQKGSGGYRGNAALKDERWANLCGANLEAMDLKNINLDYSDLSHAHLSNSNLTRSRFYSGNLVNATLRQADLSFVEFQIAHLEGADMTSANLHGTQLRGSFLQDADLSGAALEKAGIADTDMSRATLRNADLTDATLVNAKMISTDMSATILIGTHLFRAVFTDANVSGAVFEPRIEKNWLPDIVSLSEARGLSRMTFQNSSRALAEIRTAFRNEGLREAERQITYAIKHTERLQAWEGGFTGKVECVFNYLFFEVPTNWGMVPGKAIRLMGFLILGFAFIYSMSIRLDSPNGIWRVWVQDRVRKDLGSSDPQRLYDQRLITALGFGLYFSILSAFHIGWRDLNVGNWIARLQPREYTLRATGWVRTVSGIQSLLSVYLLAMWVLTYFGRPFE